MTGSAIIGQPPNNQDDYWIIKGIGRIFQIPDGVIDPNQGFPTQLHRPPNYKFETRGPGIAAGASVAIVLITLITGTRLSLRAFRKELRWGLDDWMIIPAAVGAIGWLGCVIGMVSYGGNGKHQWDVTYLEYYWFFRLAGIAELIFWITVGLIKVSITLFNRRLTGLTSARWMVAHNIFLFLLVTYILVALFVSIFGCSPRNAHYSLIEFGRVDRPVKCLNPNTIGITLSTFHVVFDFALLSVPLIILYKINMNLSKKLRLAFLFSVGSMSCIGSALRQHYQLKTQIDFMWEFRLQLNWTIVDIFFAIMAASLPVLNAAIPKKWRSNSNSLHILGHFDVNTNHGSQRLGSNEKIGDDSQNAQQVTKNFNDERRAEFVLPEIPPTQGLQDPVPTHRELLCQGSRKGEDVV